jgi:hypothetical protein
VVPWSNHGVDSAHFGRLIELVARALLGEPNESLSTKNQLRFGSRGSLSIDLRRAIWHDFEDGAGGGVLDLIRREAGLTGRDAFAWLERGFDIAHAAPPRRLEGQTKQQAILPAHPELASTLEPFWRRLWDTCRPIEPGDEAASYLTGRSCALPPIDGDLMWQPSLRHPSGWTGPALVALISDIHDCEPMSLIRTWIDPAHPGRKAPVKRPRLFLKNHSKKGCVVRLWPDDAVTTGLAVGEGVETMLSAARGFTPVWSLIDSGNLSAMPVLDGIESLTVVVDHDPGGLKAFDKLAARWHEAGREVRRMLVPREGADFNSWAAGDADG